MTDYYSFSELDCTPVPPGEMECCDLCAGARQREARMTPLGWTTFHNAHKRSSRKEAKP